MGWENPEREREKNWGSNGEIKDQIQDRNGSAEEGKKRL